MLTLITIAQILLYTIGIVVIVSLTLVYIRSEFLGYTKFLEKENSETNYCFKINNEEREILHDNVWLKITPVENEVYLELKIKGE